MPDVTPINGDYEKVNNPGLTLAPPSKKDIAWMVVRRFVKGAAGGAFAVLTDTRDITAISIGALAGGVLAGAEKLNKENRKAAGKTSFMDLLKRTWQIIIDWKDYLKQRKEVK